MTRTDAQLLQAISQAQQIAIHYVRNADYSPHTAWLGDERTLEAMRMAQGLVEYLDSAVREQQSRTAAYEVHNSD